MVLRMREVDTRCTRAGPRGRRAGPLRALVAACVALAALGCGPEPRGPRPDVVVVLIDTLRPDHLELHGYERATAPFLAELARGSAVCRNARSSSSWTAPATASLLTGLYPLRHGVTLGVRAQREQGHGDADASLPFQRLPEDVPTLAERFGAAGYRTFAVTTNVNAGPTLGLLRGFDAARPIRGADAEAVAGAVEDWEARLRGAPSPYLLYLHFMDPHGPYHGHEPWYEHARDERTDIVNAYDSEIRYFDRAFRAIHERMGWDENTLLVLLSDHGEEFWEHGRLGHGFGLYRELNDILFMIGGPGVAPATIETPVSIVDALPTLAALAGLPPAPGDGRSLAPLLADPARVPEALDGRVLFAHRTGGTKHLWAALDGPWKLVEGPDGTALYDRRNDPEEDVDVSDRHPDVRDRLAARLAEHRAPGIRDVARTRVDLDADTRAALEALGYVGAMEGGP